MSEETRPKVLVVDDDLDFLEVVKVILDAGEYEVITASNGVEAMEKTRSEKPDLLILDAQMPKKDGFTAFGEMRKDPELKGIPVIMLTGISERTGIGYSSKSMGEFFGAEPNAYLEKPVEPAKLLETVKSALGA